MYISWYAYRSPSGVSWGANAIAAIAAAWMIVFFVYFMIEESPRRPEWHTAAVFIYYCTIVLTYVALYERGYSEIKKQLIGDKSR